MHVLITLADAGGAVVTRERLTELCWSGLTIGDDAINRAISGIRRGLRETGIGAVIETIPRIGYRLTCDSTAAKGLPRGWPRRRVVLAGSAAAVTALSAFGSWRLVARRRDPLVAALVERGRIAIRDQLPDGTQQGIGFFEEALRLAPDDAAAWGNLALAWRNVSEYAPPEDISRAVSACEAAAKQAIALDADQPEAHAALALLPPIFGDWLAAERRLRAVHARFPRQTAVLGELALLMFSVGRAREAAGFSRRATELEPLSPIYQYRYTYHLWTTGHDAQADQAADRAMQMWPTHPAVWFARFLLFACTGRRTEAMRMLTTPFAAETLGALADTWRTTCDAVASGSPVAIAEATAVNVAVARRDGSACVSAILALNLLGAIDEAFVVAEGYLLRRGPLATDIGGGLAKVNDQRWRKTMMLFVPATAPMRADPRFARLCDEVGFTEYWQRSGSEPYFRQRQ